MTAPGAAGPHRLAALWLDCYERLAAAAAHEVNNALNGVAMNLEVVRLRAAPGADAARVAPFAAAAAAEHEATVALAGALLALGRAARDGAAVDVAAVLGHAAAVIGAVARHRGVAVRVGPAGGALAGAPRTSAPARAVRLAVCAAVDAAAAAAGERAAPAGLPDGDPGRVVWCNVESSGGPTLVVAPGPFRWADDLGAALAGAGVRAAWGPDGVRVAFPPA